MNQEDARRAILAEWPDWVAREGITGKPNYDDASMFYLYLETEKPYLLAFKYSGGDKWQAVHGWLRSARILAD